MINISEGIEKRLTDNKNYKAASLVWAKLCKIT